MNVQFSDTFERSAEGLGKGWTPEPVWSLKWVRLVPGAGTDADELVAEWFTYE